MNNLSNIKFNKHGIKVVLVNTKNPDIIELLSTVLDKSYNLSIDNNTIFILDKISINLSDVIDTINVDFDSSITLFESGKIYNLENLNKLINLVNAINKQGGYLSTLGLINYLNLNEKLNEYKEILLGSISINKEMEQFIDLFLENDLNATLCAKNGYMHRNTINYKLEQIKEETNLDIRKFKNAMAIYDLIKK